MPLIIRAPDTTPAGNRGKRAGGIAELVDMYPTLADVMGLPTPAGTVGNGKSLASMLRDPENEKGPNEYALSIYPRCGDIATGSDSCNQVKDSKLSYMGYAIRDMSYRYVSWRTWNGTTQTVDWNAEPFARELYDHRDDQATGVDFDEWDLVNLAGDPKSKDAVEKYEGLLKEHYVGGKGKE